METITIPSPSAFLSSPVLKPAPEPPPPPKKRKQSTSKPSAAQSAKKEHSINKPKQSKSRNGKLWMPSFSYLLSSWLIRASVPRNKLHMLTETSYNLLGCITCKAKRLKCDETKPSCQQCHKRGVSCGGYKKDFKWRPFEEATFTNKPPPPPAAKKRGTTMTTNSIDWL